MRQPIVSRQAGDRPGLARRAAARWQAGMVTVEAAIVIPLLLVAGLLAVGAPALVAAQIRCADAARDVALMLAREVPARQAAAALAEQAPPGAHMTVRRTPSSVAVTVEAHLSPLPGPFAGLVAVEVRGRAVAPREAVGLS